jgi:acetyl-CoA acetyltransferase
MAEAYLVGGVRTPVGRYGGALAGVRADDLAALVVGEVVRRTGVDPDQVDEVVLGAANQAGEDNRNVARMAVLLAGLPESVPAHTVNRLCASGLTAVANARRPAVGQRRRRVAGGVESMTRAPVGEGQAGTPWAKPGEVHDTSLAGASSTRARPEHTITLGQRPSGSPPSTGSPASSPTLWPEEPGARGQGGRERSFDAEIVAVATREGQVGGAGDP